MVDELETLRSENATQRAQIAELIATIAKLNERVGELLAIAQRKQRAKTTPSQKKAEPPPVLDADAQKAFDELPGRPSCRRGRSARRGPLAAQAGVDAVAP